VATAITVDFSQLRQRIALQRQALSDTAIKARLVEAANAYIGVMRADIDSKVSSRASGNMKEALSTIVGPWQTATGWAIGVGDIARVGLPSDAPASRSTIRDFLNWFNRQLEEEPEERVVTAFERRKEGRRRRKEAPTAAERQADIAKQATARRRIAEEAGTDLRSRALQRYQELVRQGAITPSAVGAKGDARRMAMAHLDQQMNTISRQLSNLRRQADAGGNRVQIQMQRIALQNQEAMLERLARMLRGIE